MHKIMLTSIYGGCNLVHSSGPYGENIAWSSGDMIAKISLALIICLLGLSLVHRSHAQDSKEDYLNAHNAARAEVGVPPLTWDDTVASYAQNYANQRIGDCNLVHSGGPYGENIAWSSGDMKGTDAVNIYVEK
uniref:SCP domain-containing protein n=1 Tax=Fagus sylvatica TaxID=28930 RepID=A0A2N9HXZ0_FAGSY